MYTFVLHRTNGDKAFKTGNLYRDTQHQVILEIEDDGIGNDPEKRNHYGMAIIQERAHQLAGNVEIKKRDSGDTGVYFRFTPEAMRKPAAEY